jgi:hypothetical protein
MAFQDYINDPASAYNGTDSSGMRSTAGWLGTPYRQSDQDTQPYQQPQALPVPGAGTQGTSGQGAYGQGGVNRAPQSMAVPGQANFDAIQKTIMAQQSPYVSFGANGWLQNNHPAIASRLDNAFLAAANTPQGHTIGENISAVAKGVIGGRQEQLQHNIQQAMLPVEMQQRQMAFQKQYVDINKDIAQTNNANQESTMNMWKGRNYERQSQLASSNYTGQRVGTDGFLYGINKNTNRDEKIPGQPGMGDDDQPDQSKGIYAVPGAGSGKPNMTELYLAASKGDKGAQAALDAYSRTQAGIAGGKTGAVINANTPKDFLQSEGKAAMDAVGPAPQTTTADFRSWRAAQVRNNTPMERIPDESTWKQNIMSQYNAKKAAAQQSISEYTKSGAWQKGISRQDYEAIRNKTALTPGAAQPAPQRAPVGLPGAAQQQGPNPNDPLGFQQQR